MDHTDQTTGDSPGTANQTNDVDVGELCRERDDYPVFFDELSLFDYWCHFGMKNDRKYFIWNFDVKNWNNVNFG